MELEGYVSARSEERGGVIAQQGLKYNGITIPHYKDLRIISNSYNTLLEGVRKKGIYFIGYF